MKKADFSPGAIHIKATGEVGRNQDEKTSKRADLVFKVPGTGQTFLLMDRSPQKPKGHTVVRTMTRLRERLQTGEKKFTISARVVEDDKDHPGLLLEQLEERVDEK